MKRNTKIVVIIFVVSTIIILFWAACECFDWPPTQLCVKIKPNQDDRIIKIYVDKEKGALPNNPDAIVGVQSYVSKNIYLQVKPGTHTVDISDNGGGIVLQYKSHFEIHVNEHSTVDIEYI